jgi:hypothetical protein
VVVTADEEWPESLAKEPATEEEKETVATEASAMEATMMVLMKMDRSSPVLPRLEKLAMIMV